MAASTIDRTNVTLTNDTGSASAPNGDGTLFQNSWVQAFMNAIDAMWSASLATFGGKVRVEGAGLEVKVAAAPAVSASGEGKIYFDSTTNRFMKSENAGAFVPLSTTSYAPTVADVVNTTTRTATLSFTVPANEMADGDVIHC